MEHFYRHEFNTISFSLHEDAASVVLEFKLLESGFLPHDKEIRFQHTGRTALDYRKSARHHPLR